jgi:hypothetical protein
MWKYRPAPTSIPPDPGDPPPALTGDLDADAEAALAFLWAHEDSWLATGAKDAAHPTGLVL